jgi:predicted Zn-ribbon and HTH transcriptional regulator
MKKTPKNPFVPPERHGTLRKEIMDLLAGQILSAKELSGAVGIPVKEVYGHLEHIQRSMSKGGYRFSVLPAECKKCGFVFRKRERVKKPGKCPVCRGESIQEPLFSIART